MMTSDSVDQMLPFMAIEINHHSIKLLTIKHAYRNKKLTLRLPSLAVGNMLLQKYAIRYAFNQTVKHLIKIENCS